VSRTRLLLALVVVAAAARSISLTWLHPLNWDEIEYFRATDWVRQGLIPYRDFWEHHTPLQWFLFAPVAALIRSEGAAAIIAMRWAQVPLWIATLWLLWSWMREAGNSLVARWSVVLLLLCSSMFMLAAVEYRIDTVGCFFYVLALVLLQRVDRNAWFGFAAGSALCLAGFANIRLGPLLLLTALLARVMRPGERAWGGGGKSAANSIFAGIAATFTLCSIYFLATGSASVAFRRAWVENYLADRLSEDTAWIFLHRLAVPFGFRLIGRGQQPFEPASLDLATVSILILGLVGLGRVLADHRRSPDYLFFLGILQVGSLLFVGAMKFVYHYHFEIILLMMLPFVGAEIDRLLVDRWKLVAAGLLIVSAMNLFASLLRGKEADLAYQDLIMREVHRQTPPGSSVFDGVGWALRRRPAYRYWFLPALVRNLEAKGLFESYTVRQLAVDPPAAIIADHNAYAWMATHPPFAAFVTAHYLPVWRNLWVPAMSGRLTPAAPTTEWIVPATGAYRIYGSPVLSIHPWFRDPVVFGTFESRGTEITLTGFAPANRLPLDWVLDGAPMVPADVLPLRRLQRLRVISHAASPFGVMIVPAGVTDLFQQPAHGVTLDGAAPAVTHVPTLPDLFR
jgi:drug/metabolite transporter superfamily protein YnfA